MTQDDFNALADARPDMTLGEARPVVFGQVLSPSAKHPGHFMLLSGPGPVTIHLAVEPTMSRLTVQWWNKRDCGVQCDVTGDRADIEQKWLETARLETPRLAARVVDMMASNGGGR